MLCAPNSESVTESEAVPSDPTGTEPRIALVPAAGPLEIESVNVTVPVGEPGPTVAVTVTAPPGLIEDTEVCTATVDEARMRIVSCCVADRPNPSVTRTVKAKVPPAVGVPEIPPVAGSNVRPL